MIKLRKIESIDELKHDMVLYFSESNGDSLLSVACLDNGKVWLKSLSRGFEEVVPLDRLRIRDLFEVLPE